MRSILAPFSRIRTIPHPLLPFPHGSVKERVQGFPETGSPDTRPQVEALSTSLAIYNAIQWFLVLFTFSSSPRVYVRLLHLVFIRQDVRRRG